MTQCLKLLTKARKFDLMLSFLCGICCFLIFDSDRPLIWIIFGIVLVGALMFKPKMITIALIIFLISFVIQNLLRCKNLNFYINGHYKVINVLNRGPVIVINYQQVLLYSFENYQIGDVILVQGLIESPTQSLNFDNLTYLKSLNVGNVIVKPTIAIISKDLNLRNTIINYFTNGSSLFAKMAPLILFGQKTRLNQDVYQLTQSLNTIHLFVVSGFHISLLNWCFKKVFSFCQMPKKWGPWVALGPIVFYCYILNFTISVTRVLWSIILNLINHQFLKSRYNSLTILGFVMILLFCLSPWTIYSVSFILSFGATFAILLSLNYPFVNKHSSYLWLIVSPYLMTLPILIYLNGEFNLWGLFFNWVLAPIFAIMFGLTLCFWPLQSVLEVFYAGFIVVLQLYQMLNITIFITSLNLEIFQAIYLLPVCWLIMDRRWNSFTDQNLINFINWPKKL